MVRTNILVKKEDGLNLFCKYTKINLLIVITYTVINLYMTNSCHTNLTPKDILKLKTLKIIIDDVETKTIKVKDSEVNRLLEIIDLYNQA